MLNGVHSHFLPYNGDRPVTAWKENTHANKAVGRLTVDRHWRFGTRRAADIVDWDNRSPSVFETGSVGAAPTSTAIYKLLIREGIENTLNNNIIDKYSNVGFFPRVS